MSVIAFNQQGKRITEIALDRMLAGHQTAAWNARRAFAGADVCRVELDGVKFWTGKLFIGK